jgi:hypothetical protein
MKLIAAACSAVLGTAATPALAYDAIPQSLAEFNAMYNTVLAATAQQNPIQNCFPTYCSLVKSTQYQGWWWTVAERQFNTGVTAHEYCVGYPALRRCYQSDGMVWDEFLDVTSQIWRVSDVVRHSWWG